MSILSSLITVGFYFIKLDGWDYRNNNQDY